MSYADASVWSGQRFVIEAPLDERVSFIRKTYFHLAVAVAAFAMLEAALLNIPAVTDLALTLMGRRIGWFLMMGGFMFVSYLAESWARNSASKPLQYAGLSLYVFAEAVFFVPLMLAAQAVERATESDVIGPAGLITVVVFGGLSAIVFVTKKDFSFLRSFLFAAGWVAFGLIACSMFFNFGLGTIFSGAMVLVACGWILYDTSKVMHHYRTDQYVAASLALFASVALLFWYVLRLVMASRD